MIYIECTGGLCNRIRAINAAYALASIKKDNLVIVWKQNGEIMTPFHDIFELGGLNNNISIKVLNIPYKKTRIGRRLYVLFNKLYRIGKNNVEINKYMRQDSRYINPYDPIFCKKNIYIESCEEFIEPKNEQILFFTKKIMDKVADLVGDGEYVGVHIRRTDNIQAIKNSTSEDFINKMEELVNINDNQKFYVASDSQDEILRLKEHFPNQIIENQDKILDRSNVQGGIDAAIDLCCLTKSKMILGSKGSAFSMEAAKMGNIPLCIIEKDRDFG